MLSGSLDIGSFYHKKSVRSMRRMEISVKNQLFGTIDEFYGDFLCISAIDKIFCLL